MAYSPTHAAEIAFNKAGGSYAMHNDDDDYVVS